MGTPPETQAEMRADQLAELADDTFHYELDEGELIIMAPAGEEHGRLEGRLFGLMFDQVERRGLGTLYLSDTGFVLQENPDVLRSPDIAFVRKQRLPLPCSPRGFIMGAPDLAVEVQSPSQSPADMERKVRQYLSAGAEAVWLIHPRKRRAWMYSSSETVDTAGTVETVEIDGSLRAPNVLPGISILLRDLFRDEAS